MWCDKEDTFFIKCNLAVFVKFDTDKFLGEKKSYSQVWCDWDSSRRKKTKNKKQTDKSFEGLCTVCFTVVLKFLFLIGNDQWWKNWKKQTADL